MKRCATVLLSLAGLWILGGNAFAADPKTLQMAFQPDENLEKLRPKSEAFVKFMEPRVGMPVKTFLTTNFAAILEALRAGQIQVAYVGAWAGVLAKQNAHSEFFLAEDRNGKTSYTAAWFVRKDDKTMNTLADLKGKRLAFTNQVSASGYLFPHALLVEKGLLKKGQDPADGFASNVIFAGGYEQALRALVSGQVDAAASSDYSPEKYLPKEDQAKIRILAAHGPVPTHGLVMRTDLSPALKKKIIAAFLDFNKPENTALLVDLYGAKKLVPVNHDEHVASIAKSMEQTGRKFDPKHKDAK